MADSFGVRYAVMEALENVYLGSWSYGKDPRLQFPDVRVYFHPNTVYVSGTIVFYYTNADSFIKEAFRREASNVYSRLKSKIAEALREYARESDDPDVSGEWTIDIEGVKVSLEQD